jgi:ribosomal protein S12 methylthiotransferase
VSASLQEGTAVALVHLGCARNLIDSELILARLAEEGLMVSGSEEGAQTVVVNTCSFIGPARDESEAAIRRLEQRKRDGELRHVVVAGCLVQRYKHKLERRFPLVDVFAEISDYRELARTVAGLHAGKKVRSYLASPGLREATRDGSRLLATPTSYAYLRISHGCDHTCAFCAIPGIRGPHRSKPLEVVLDEARELIDAGVRELVLVAEDSTAWGRELGLELPDLVEALAELPGEHRVRVMYAYPHRFPWRLTELLGGHPRVLPYLDMPVQHVATGVLRAMHRGGTGRSVRAILDRLLAEVPGLTLRTTLLLGFPGETDAQAAEVAEFVRSYGLGRVGAFIHSREEGTKAFDLDGAVPEAVARERYLAVLAARDEALRISQNALIGSEVEILIDESHPGAEGSQSMAIGRPPMDAPEVDLIATIADSHAAVGERVRARVEGVDEELNLICRALTHSR